jgi:NAD-dependent deacetylase
MKKINSIVVLTGAGISAESGISTFRDSNGLWENHAIEDVATPYAFLFNPSLVHSFYNARRRQLLSSEVAPNPAHLALAKLAREFKGNVLIVTQNVDDLHERAGSRNLLHMHGELLKVRCERSNAVYQWEKDLLTSTECPCCESEGSLRPNIVWFGETPFHMDQIEDELRGCDLFLSIGTSGIVYPAANFVKLAPGAIKMEVNLTCTESSNEFDRHLVGPAGAVLPVVVEQILDGTII